MEENNEVTQLLIRWKLEHPESYHYYIKPIKKKKANWDKCSQKEKWPPAPSASMKIHTVVIYWTHEWMYEWRSLALGRANQSSLLGTSWRGLIVPVGRTDPWWGGAVTRRSALIAKKGVLSWDGAGCWKRLKWLADELPSRIRLNNFFDPVCNG